MARAIDVDRVKREIRKNKEKIVISCKQKYVPLSLIYEILNKAPTLTQPNEWVSVEDTVPDPGERVLATDGIFVGEAYRTSADSWHRHTGFPWRDGVTGRTVKYWMLLPAPPAKEGQK